MPRSVYNINPKLDYFLGRIRIEADDTGNADFYGALYGLGQRAFIKPRHIVPNNAIIPLRKQAGVSQVY
jgi:hypothetical protein